MVCIYCGQDTNVTNSRAQRRNNNIWRRRLCSQCAASFTTIEKPELAGSFRVRKNATTLEPFVKEHLFLSIYKSCPHRSTAVSDAAALTESVLAALPFPAGEPIESHAIAQVAHAVLQRFDEVAASVYKAYYLQPDTTS